MNYKQELLKVDLLIKVNSKEKRGLTKIRKGILEVLSKEWDNICKEIKLSKILLFVEEKADYLRLKNVYASESCIEFYTNK